MKVLTIFALLLTSPVLSAPQDFDAQTDDVLCTTEYDPTICEYEGMRFQGTNACLARTALEAYAKNQRLILDETAIICFSESAF